MGFAHFVLLDDGAQMFRQQFLALPLAEKQLFGFDELALRPDVPLPTVHTQNEDHVYLERNELILGFGQFRAGYFDVTTKDSYVVAKTGIQTR